MKKIEIKLTQDAYINLATNNWSSEHTLQEDYEYKAGAVDEQGNTYIVYWDIREDYDQEIMEEDMACDWDEPREVIDDYGNDVTDSVVLVFK